MAEYPSGWPKKGRANILNRAKSFYLLYESAHWKTCLEDDCPTCQLFEQIHPVKRSELRKLKEEVEDVEDRNR